jgi:CRP-like cAMP-binding protein
MINPLIATLERRDQLSDEEKAVLKAVACPTTIVRAGQDIACEGSRPGHSTLVLSGLAARYNTLRDGARQISAVHVPGDFVDLHSFLLHIMDHGVTALSDCAIATFPHEALTRLTEQFPHLTRVLWLSTLIDAAVHRRWIVAMGRQSSTAQLAHLICELHIRLSLVGLVEDDSFELKLTQSDLSDVLGLSLVHVNRTIQQLKATGLIAWRRRKVRILDLARLRGLAEFDPTYLHLENERR